MCNTPIKARFPDPKQPDFLREVMVKCPRQGKGVKWCLVCRRQYVSDYVGRCLAESAVSDAASTVTLTYAPRDDLSDKIINPAHFQKFVRSLRRRGHKLRYLAAGEYGELKGRAHFHAVLFFRGDPVEIAEKKRAWLDAWPHGHTYWEHHASDRAIRYVCKYLLKSSAKETWKSQSTKPVLGWEWFRSKANYHIENGIYPTSFEYRAPGDTGKTRYFMRGTLRWQYLKYIRDGLGDGYRDNPENLSEWVDRACRTIDTIEERERERYLDPIEQKQALRDDIDRKRPGQAGVNAMLVDTFGPIEG